MPQKNVKIELYETDMDRAPRILRLALRALEVDGAPFGYSVLDDIAEQIEAQSKPPRIDEPGLWAVVVASRLDGDGVREDYVRYPAGWTTTTQIPQRWSELVDPTLVREGLS